MTKPVPPPTYLRDARLHKALEHAPDAHAAAPAAIREAILRQARHAHHAAAPIPTPSTAASPPPWWKRMLGSPPRAHRPWNAAFVSVLLAGVIVGLWWDQEVPGPQPEAAPRDLPAATPPPDTEAPAPVRPPSPSPSPAPAPATAPQSTPAPARTEAREAARPPPGPQAPARVRRDESKVATPDAMPQPQPQAEPPNATRAQQNAAAPNVSPPQQKATLPDAIPPQQPPAAPQDRSREKQSAAGAQGATAMDATPASPGTAEQRPSSGDRLGSALRSSRIAPTPAAPSTPPATAPLPQAGANDATNLRGATQAIVPRPAAALEAAGWTALQVLPGAGQARTRSALPADVRQAIDVMLDTGPTAVPADDPVLLQILLLHDNGRPLGRLDLGSHSLRWAPAGAVTPRAFAARVEPALSLRVRQGLALR